MRVVALIAVCLSLASCSGPRPSFGFSKEVALARMAAASPDVASAKWGAAILTGGKRYYPLSGTYLPDSEEIRAYTDQADNLIELRMVDSAADNEAGASTAASILLSATAPTLAKTQRDEVIQSAMSLGKNRQRGSVAAGDARLIVAAGGIGDTSYRAIPATAQDPMTR